MKSTVLLSLLVMIMSYECARVSEDEEKKSAPDEKNRSESTVSEPGASLQVPLDTAQACIAYYQTGSPIAPDQLHGFTIHAQDMLQALGISGKVNTEFDHARVYIGRSADGKFHLYFTPVVGANLDTIPKIPGRDTILGQKPNEPNSGYVLDLNAPCPSTCAENNILNPSH